MILTFSKERFKNLILAGIKIHTIREDKNSRWKPVMTIHHWLFNPRHQSKHPHQFGVNQCVSIQSIDIRYDEFMFQRIPHIYIDDLKITNKEAIRQLIINDGFESERGFFAWFNKDFTGKIIHWTEKRY